MRRVDVVLNAALGQFEVSLGGKKAILTFHERGGSLSLIHAEVPKEFRGKHIADALSAAALDYARRQGFTVKPYCPFVAGYLKRHPEYANLVDPSFK